MLTYRKIHSPAEEAQPRCNQQPIYLHLYHRFLLQTEARGDDTTCKRYEKKNESPKSLQPFMECYINKQDWRNSCIAGYFRSQSKTLWKKNWFKSPDLVTTWWVYTFVGLPKDLASPKSPIFKTPLSSINKLFGFISWG